MKKNLSTILLLLINLFFWGQKENRSGWSVTPFERKVFIENKGQFNHYKEYDDVDKQNLKYCIDKDYKVFFYPNKITYKFTDIKFISKHSPEGKGKPKEERRKVTTQQITVEWLNANPSPLIINEQPDDASYIYSGKNQSNNQTFYYNCKGYKKITYKNLYNNIDIEYFFHPDAGIKYNIILHPGANISDVKLKYNGSQASISNKNIVLPTLKGDIIEHAPKTFYKNNPSQIILSSYALTNNILTFNLNNIDHSKEVIIDPWVTVPSSATPPLDNGVDNSGNIYLYGKNKIAEKYNASGSLIWSLTPGIDRAYYGDLLVESSGNFYLCEGFRSGGARTYKFDPTSALIWQSTSAGNFREHWRLAINCVTQKVIVAGGGTTSPTLNIAEVDVSTGTLVNAKSVYNGSQSDVAGLTVDQTGKSYLKHSNPNIVTFTDNANNTLANVGDGYGYSEIGGSYNSPNGNGYNLMTLGSNFLYTSDGSTIKKWDITTFSIVASATIPGSPRGASGILADDCNNLFIGGANGVYRFDFNLVQQEFHATPSPVYDIAFSATNSDIIACGSGFLTPLPFGRISCASANKVVTIDSCYTSINSIEIHPTLGLAPFTFLWSDGNTDSVRTNLPPGTYKVTIKDSKCVPSFIFDSVVIPEKLFIATIDFDTVCSGLPTHFQGSAPLPVGTTNSWEWDFGDNNNTSTLQNPEYIFSNNGTYTVSLIATNSNGCKDTTTQQVLVNATPTPSFSVEDVCVHFNSVFTENSTINPPDVNNSYNWDFGDGNHSTLQSPTHLYSSDGSYDVKLVVTSDKNCSDSLNLSTTIFPKPIAAFGVTQGCLPSIDFTDSSTVTSGSIDTWEWNFDDGTSSTTQNPNHNYSYDTNFSPTLIVTTNNGCKDTTSRTTIQNALPTANFSITPECLYDSLTFTDLSTVASSSTITNWVWNFGDGSSFVSNQNTKHKYNSAGSYNVTLITTTNNGCIDDTSFTALVYPIPIANFTTTTVCENTPPTYFMDMSSVSSGSLIGWQWDFNDGNTSTLPNPSNAYTTNGIYNVELIVTSNHNCKDTTELPVTVLAKPTADFSEDKTEGCSPVCVNFQDNSLTNASSIDYWFWSYGNGDAGFDQNPSVCYENTSYTNDAVYSVTLIVKNDLGCYDTLTKTDLITSYHNPISDFVVTPDEANMYEGEITTTNNSIGADDYFWDFDNDTTSTLFEPVIHYTDTGVYNVMLVANTIHNCSDTSFQNVKIIPVISIFIPNAFTPDGDGNNDGFIFKGYGIDLATTKFYIFDRWGTLIYYTENNTPWDGTYKGQKAIQDTYVYKLFCKDDFGKPHKFIGHVNLLR